MNSPNNFSTKVNSSSQFSFPQTIEISNSFDLKGHVKCWAEEDGVKTLLHEKSNLIVNGARKALSHLIAESSPQYILSQFKIGTGGHVIGDILTPIAPSIIDTDLEDPVFTKPIGSFEYLPSGAETSVKFTIVIEKFEANGTGVVAYTEAGLYTTDGTLFARETFPAVVKNDARKVTFEWTILF